MVNLLARRAESTITLCALKTCEMRVNIGSLACSDSEERESSDDNGFHSKHLHLLKTLPGQRLYDQAPAPFLSILIDVLACPA